MRLFDKHKKKIEITTEPEPQRLENFPEMLIAKLLFIQKPILDPESILREAKGYFANIQNSSKEGGLIFAFPDFQFELLDAKGYAQCLVAMSDEKRSEIEIPDIAFQQNWHWLEANNTAKSCNYELIVTDLLTRTLEYKQRLNLFMDFLVAVTKATNPDVIYSVHGQKLIKPTDLINLWEKPEKQILYGICNVRLYNITETVDKEILMDTVGLYSIGLPDFQIRFSGFQENEIASLLWNYAYYLFDYGDVIENGNTLEGLSSGSKWKCERQVSPLQPERIIINVLPT